MTFSTPLLRSAFSTACSTARTTTPSPPLAGSPAQAFVAAPPRTPTTLCAEVRHASGLNDFINTVRSSLRESEAALKKKRAQAALNHLAPIWTHLEDTSKRAHIVMNNEAFDSLCQALDRAFAFHPDAFPQNLTDALLDIFRLGNIHRSHDDRFKILAGFCAAELLQHFNTGWAPGEASQSTPESLAALLVHPELRPHVKGLGAALFFQELSEMSGDDRIPKDEMLSDLEFNIKSILAAEDAIQSFRDAADEIIPNLTRYAPDGTDLEVFRSDFLGVLQQVPDVSIRADGADDTFDELLMEDPDWEKTLRTMFEKYSETQTPEEAMTPQEIDDSIAQLRVRRNALIEAIQTKQKRKPN